MALTPPPSWASDTNYDAGSNAWSGLPTKRAPSAGEIAKGKIPGAFFFAQTMNYLLSAFAARISTLNALVEAAATAAGMTATDASTSVLADAIAARARNMAIANLSLNTATYGGFVTSAIAANTTRIVLGMTTGEIYTSDNHGLTWDARTSNTTKAINGIAWNGSIFVAVCADREIVTSPDGTTWTARTSNVVTATADINAVCWDSTNSRFIAAGMPDPTYGLIITSPDGITWTRQSAHETGTAATWESVAAGGGKALVATGPAIATPRVSYSTNGTTFGASSVATTIQECARVVFFAGKFVLLAENASATVGQSATFDGTTWVVGTALPTGSGGLASLCFEVGGLLYAGSTFTSSDGLVWTRIGYGSEGAGGAGLLSGFCRGSLYAFGRLYHLSGTTAEMYRSLQVGSI